MMNANPDKPQAEQKISDGRNDPHGAIKIPNTSARTVDPQEQTQQPYYGWNLRRTTPYQRLNMVIMTLIFIVTGIYAIFSYLQWDVLQSSMKLEQRAWMGITHMIATGAIGKPESISVGFVNTGKTPAKIVHTITLVDIINCDADPDFAKIQHSPTESRGVAAPQQPITSTYDFEKHHKQITEMETLKIISGSMRVVVYGVITYEDIFGVHHWLKYCAYLTGDGKTFATYDKNNDPDDN